MKQLPHFRELQPSVRRALEAARAAAAPLPIYAVGGFVRDLLLGIRSVDVDLVVEGDAIAVARRLGQCLQVAVAAHPRFGTARLRLSEGVNLDLATARSEQYPASAALPEVRPARLLADLARRDFSMNAMAARVSRHRFGPLIDPVGGFEDLREGRIRVLHERSFIEDPTRIFRAARFEARYRFVIARGTVKLIRTAVSEGVISYLAGSRIFTELLLIGKEPTAPRIFRRLSHVGVFAAVHPSLAKLEAAFGQFGRVGRVLAQSRSWSLGQPPAPGEVYLLGMLFPLRPTTATAVLRRLNPPGRLAGKLAADLAACRRTAGQLAGAAELHQSRIARIVDPLSPQARALVVATLAGRSRQKAVSEYLRTSCRILPLLKGEDLRRLGLRPGPIYRKVFAALRSARLDGQVRTRQEEISFVRRRFATTGLQD